MSDPPIERRLTAILHADVVGYSRHMGSNEDATIRAVNAQFEIVERQVKLQRGRLADFTGDAFLAEFPSTGDAVTAALNIQSESRLLVSPTQPFRLRIGLHVGDVRVDADKIYGDTIHIAARLQALAEPGGICLSATVQEQLIGKIDLPLRKLGPQQLKNITRPIIAFAVAGDLAKATAAPSHTPVRSLEHRAPRSLRRRTLLTTVPAVLGLGGLGFLAYQRNWFARSTASDNSIAVLPFENLSDSDEDFFSRGIAEEVRAMLARNSMLRVMAETSSSQFRLKDTSAPDIARSLGVSYLLSGSVRRSGNLARITANLVEGATGFNRWSQVYSRQITDVFTVQTEIASAVVNAVASIAADSESAAAALVSPGMTADVRAYDLFLRGRAAYDLAHDETTELRALALLDEATAVDPKFALAHAIRARSQIAIANLYGDLMRRQDLFEQAIVASQRAIDLAPELADGYSMLGTALMLGRLDARGAQGPFDRSLALGAGDARIQGRYAVFASRIGKSENARVAAIKSKDLDHLNALVHVVLADIEYSDGNYDAVFDLINRALNINADLGQAHRSLGNAWYMKGRYEQALHEFELEPIELSRLTGLAMAQKKLGNTAAANSALQQMQQTFGESSWYQQAVVFAQWAQTDNALAALEKARLAYDPGLADLFREPMFAVLSKETRFAVLLKSIGFD